MGNDGAWQTLFSAVVCLRARQQWLKPLGGQGQEFRCCGQVPIGGGRVGMADVGGQGQHLPVDGDLLRLPEQDGTHDEGVSQVMNARCAIGAAIDPAELLAQPLEELIHLAQR